MYSSVSGNRDLGDDIVLPGAFKTTLERKARPGGGGHRIPLLWQHDVSEPIGKPIALEEDSKGLLSVDLISRTKRGDEALVLAEDEVIWGGSIGFNTIKSTRDKAGVRSISELDLFERSLVTFPMNEQAQIMSVKSSLLRLSPKMQLKVGRVLKSSNMEKLLEAIELLQEILDSASPKDVMDDGGGDEEDGGKGPDEGKAKEPPDPPSSEPGKDPEEDEEGTKALDSLLEEMKSLFRAR